MTYEELQKCQLPVEVFGKYSKLKYIVTSYNKKAMLAVTEDGHDVFIPTTNLKDYRLKRLSEKVTLYKYTYYDRAREQNYETSWTTEKWSEYMPQNGNFESISFKKKVIEIEED